MSAARMERDDIEAWCSSCQRISLLPAGSIVTERCAHCNKFYFRQSLLTYIRAWLVAVDWPSVTRMVVGLVFGLGLILGLAFFAPAGGFR